MPMTGTIRRVVTGHDENGRADRRVRRAGAVRSRQSAARRAGNRPTSGAPTAHPRRSRRRRARPRSARAANCRPRTRRCCASIISRRRPRRSASMSVEESRRAFAALGQRAGRDLRQGRPPSAHAPHRDHRLRDRAVGRDHDAARRRGRGAQGRRHPGPVRHQSRLEQPLERAGGGGVYLDRRSVRAGAEGEVLANLATS